jgi:ABC-2 type transport system permease protein
VAEPLAAIANDARMARHLVRGRIRSELQYRVSFGLFLVAQMVVALVDVIAIVALFSKVNSIGGWSREQVLFLYAVSTVGFGLADLTVSSVELTAQWVRLGTFDRVMLRPAGTLAQMLGYEFELRRLGRSVSPLIVLIVTARLARIAWTPANVALVLAAIVSSALIFAALFVITSSLAFWIPSTQEVANAFTYGSNTAASYPTHVFDGWLRFWLLGPVPVSLCAYAPLIRVLGAPNPLGLPTWLQLAGPLCFVPFIAVARLVWRLGNRHYRSTGS